MKGTLLVDVLKKEFDVRVGVVTEAQWKAKANVSRTVLKNALKKFETQLLAGAIQPIAEFHRLDLNHGKKLDTLAKRIANEDLVKRLKEKAGVYAFYEGQGRLVYAGKTEKNKLFDEMNQRYKGPNAKKVPFKVLKNGKAKPQDACIADVAVYFSAYAVRAALIASVEALLTRIIINNASNLRVESFPKTK